MLMPSIFRDNLLDNWMGNAFAGFADIDKALYGKNAGNMMKTDVQEADGKYQVSVDLPGFDKNEISAELKDGYLTITASRNLNNDQQDENGRYIRRERYGGTMQRSFYVGGHVQQEDIRAKYENGVLRLEIPKEDSPAVEKSRYIAIEG